jgi:uncharacterized membrane protein YeaQ/YmgE (transglycosylase-associated protein family)
MCNNAPTIARMPSARVGKVGQSTQSTGRRIAVIGALLLGLVVGAVVRAIIPNDAFEHMSGWRSWLLSIALGLAGAALGWVIFTVLIGIGDDDIFDWGGLLSAFIGTLIVVPLASWMVRRAGGGERPGGVQPS